VLWEEWGLDDYPLKVKEPMDLGTIKTNLEKKIYTDLEVFLKDMKLVWSNCMVYNAVSIIIISCTLFYIV